MNFNFAFTVTGSTTRSTRVSQDLHISPGRITHVGIYFPSGADDVTHIQIEHHGSQVFPANPDGDYCADLMAIDFPDSVDILEAPPVLKIYGWKTTATDVVVRVNVTVLPVSVPG